MVVVGLIHGVLAVALPRGRHGDVGTPHQAFDVRAVLGIEADPQSGGYTNRLAVHKERPLEALEKLLSQDNSRCGVPLSQDNRKLIAVEPSQVPVKGLDRLAQEAGDLLQHGIRKELAESVVDLAELVQIDEQQGEAFALLVCTRDRFREMLSQPGAVWQVGQWI